MFAICLAKRRFPGAPSHAYPLTHTLSCSHTLYRRVLSTWMISKLLGGQGHLASSIIIVLKPNQCL